MNIKYDLININDSEIISNFLLSKHLISKLESDKLINFLEINSKYNCSYKVMDGEVLIGLILVSFDGIRGYIYKLVVDENYRSKGIGRELINKSINSLRKINALELKINCRKMLAKWYESMGFNTIDTIHYSLNLNNDPSIYC